MSDFTPRGGNFYFTGQLATLHTDLSGCRFSEESLALMAESIEPGQPIYAITSRGQKVVLGRVVSVSQNDDKDVVLRGYVTIEAAPIAEGLYLYTHGQFRDYEVASEPADNESGFIQVLTIRKYKLLEIFLGVNNSDQYIRPIVLDVAVKADLN